MVRLGAVWPLAMLAMLAGCTRSHYRVRADADSYALLHEKTASAPWEPPSDFTIEPHPASRFYDPTPSDDPLLPIPAPQLYAYDLPALRAQQPQRLHSIHPVGDGGVSIDPVVAIQPDRPLLLRLPPTNEGPAATPPAAAGGYAAARASFESRVRRRRLQDNDETSTIVGDQPGVAPIPTSAWDDVPLSCRRRMYDFERLRSEYELTYGTYPDEGQLDPAPRMTLGDIIDLALINSRNYQLQKELLYRVALDLSLQRFAYDLKFSASNNGTSPRLTHDRIGGITENTLSIPTTLQADKMLLTGGDLLARFANDVVLTFNGPQGFAADVGSSLLLDMSQSILQRDIRLESLTQAERDVVYAARDFARFRKELFTDLATRYYNLLRTYRQVEIDSQNYFSLVRLFNQTEAEFRAGVVPRFQVDQVEQQVLDGRSGLIDTCNNLEQFLDNLKISVGLPTETNVNVSLAELEQLTTDDELAVGNELIRRDGERLLSERQAEFPNRLVLLTASVELIDRLLEAFELQRRQGEQAGDDERLQDIRSQMLVESAREDSREVRQELRQEEQAQRPYEIMRQTLNLSDVLFELIHQQLDLAERRAVPPEQVDEFRRLLEALTAESSALRTRSRRLFQQEAGQQQEAEREEELSSLIDEARELVRRVEVVVRALDQAVGNPATPPPADVALQQTLAVADQLLEEADAVRRGIDTGLVPIDIGVDDAMMTALVLRFELMNERGNLADDWRQIKFAGDDLKSILDLSATQVIRTRADVNRVFDFTLDESQTQVRLAFDAPLNRRSQRNSFRRALINYNVGLRRLMLLEDNIKLDVRNDLRGLALRQQQYAINVVGAALASKQVTSTTLEFRMGLGIVRATDVLQAQNRYASALSRVAAERIGYVIGRMQLFLDLELMTIGDDGFWQGLYDEQYQPEPYYQLPCEAMPAYGELPHLLYTKQLRRMEQVPVGVSAIHGQSELDAQVVPYDEQPLPEPPWPQPIP